jgi:hypothetical protein
VVSAEFTHLPSTGLWCARQLSDLLVEAPECELLEGDFALELDALVAALPPAELVELAMRSVEAFVCLVSLPLDLVLPPRVQPLFDVWSWGHLVERERFGVRAFERAGCPPGRAVAAGAVSG